MPDGGRDIGENNIKQIEEKINDPSLHIAKFTDDKGFDVGPKAIEDKHIDQQMSPVSMYKSGRQHAVVLPCRCFTNRKVFEPVNNDIF